MEPNSLQWVGSPCGLHGPYIFYKAFQFHLEGKPRILSLGDFFFVRCTPKDPICIAELQLLWEERTSRQLLSSSKLYFLPEDTPQGRNSDHGEDEVIAVSEKVIVKLEDLVKWVHSDFSKWRCGLRVESVKTEVLGRNGQKEALLKYRQSTLNSGLNFKDVLKEKADLGEDEEETNVIVLSYPQYCRYRSMLKRIQDKPSSILTDQFALALGGIAVVSKKPQILYCRDTFEHPTLIENESICDEFAPNLKGRPRKKKSCPQRRDSFSGTKDSNNNSDGKAVAKVKCEARSALTKPKNNHNNCKKGSNEEKPKVSIGEECRAEEQAFLVALYKYMKERKTPIERIPYLGFKQTAQKLGGYETITARRQWKHIYDELGGNPGSTSAATCTRRHYERLILPYERFIKGEEDKPLPPVKPRKQENSSQENENKAKVSGTKRIKQENPKSKKEKENTPKPQDASEVSSEHEKEPETLNQKSVTEPLPTTDKKKKAEVHQDSASRPPTSRSHPEKDNETDQVSSSEQAAEEGPEKGPAPLLPSVPLAPERDPAVLPAAGKPSLTSASAQVDSKQEPKPCRFTESPDNELQEATSFPTAQPPSANAHEMEEGKLPAMADYIANCTVKVDQLGTDDIHNALKQTPKVLVVQSFDMFKDKDLTGPMNENHGLNYTPLLYSRGNPGIMSPLAKKKLLSQVSGASLSSNYPYGSPPPLISKKKLIARDDLCSGLSQAHHSHNTDHLAVNRPSVIQHVQSFKSKASEERKTINDIFKHDKLSRSDGPRCGFSKHHLSPLADSYVLKQEMQEGKDKVSEKRALPYSHMPSFLADFYSSPHLHSLYRHTEHHLHNEQTSKYPARDMYRESENSVFPPHKHPEKLHVNYLTSLHLQDKKPATAEGPPTDDQPTDLSLPKNPHKPTGKVLGLAHSAAGPQEGKGISQFQVISSQSRDCHPKACRVSPMTLSAAPKKYPESLSRARKPHHMRLENFRKMEGMVHPILHRKMSPQNVGSARPIKRSLEDLDLVIAGKKARAVSPLDTSKEGSGKEQASEQESDGGKAVHGGHSGGGVEGHKLPLSSPIFPGLYSGSLCNSGLNSRLPAGYSHSLQYLKNQSVLSPLMQPLAFHSLVMQRGIFTSPTNSQQLYRHLAATTPVGSSYGDLLHNSIYPLAAINPQAAFPASQLSSVHPSTKL
ncbi:AT-rich interactive domain-containing protein 5B isoform X2 [Echinops telfairi]|uniref:AT-rich interactive domain-containing protein 5B isoform X2 n=1 Tax=Echinops telfairi TaxID=9371 RepID=A0AC55D629_ECHTE|nr:AT-rich interactive domain-containing protein 5B isoform X2 [Echinops telfairi]